MTIRTNFSAQTSQLWPPQWKKEGKDGPEKTFKEKMMEKAAAAAELAAEKAAAASEKAKKKIQAKLAENFDGIKSPEEEERESLRAERKAREEEDSDDEKIKTEMKHRTERQRRASEVVAVMGVSGEWLLLCIIVLGAAYYKS